MHAFCRTYLPDWPNHRPWIWGSQSLKVGALRYCCMHGIAWPWIADESVKPADGVVYDLIIRPK